MEAVMTLPKDAVKVKSKRGLYIALGATAFVLTGGYFVFIYKDKDGKTYWKKWTGKDDVEDIPVVDEPKEASPTGTKWISEESLGANPFPLKKGMFGGRIKLLQQKFGIKPDDGKFGKDTENAVVKKFGVPTVSQAAYNSVVNPTTTAGGLNFIELKKALPSAQNTSDGIGMWITGQNKKFGFRFYAANGRFSVESSGKILKKGTYSEGGKRMKLDGDWTAYTESSALGNMKKIVEDIEG